MKPSDPFPKQIGVSQEIAKQFESYKLLQPSIEAAEALKQIQRAARPAADAIKALNMSRTAEIARVYTQQLDSYRAMVEPLRQQMESYKAMAEPLRQQMESYKAIAEPLRLQMEAYRKIIDTSGLRESIALYERQFRPAISNEILEISKIAQQTTRPEWLDAVTQVRTDFERQIAAFRAPLIDIQDSFKSFRTMSQLAAMGAAVRTIAPFEPALVVGLRAEIGDWREAEIDVSPLLDDPAGRIAVFEEQGFNSALTDFPAEGFEAALSVTQIELGLVATELSPPPAGSVPSFNKGAYDWLFVFERELRSFIERRLSSIDPKPWKTRIPPKMHDEWQARKAEALAKGEPEQPLIHYADFADYSDIILGRANWRDCFKSTFKHEEAVREGFNRLRPIRVVVAHMRVLTAAEWLTLNIEVRRFLRAIGKLG